MFPAGAEAAADVADGAPSSMAAPAAPDANVDMSGLSQMPMFAVLALLQPQITDTSQLQRAPLPAAEHATLAQPIPAQAALEQQQLLQSPLHSSAEQALAAVMAAVTPSPDRLAQQQQQQVSPQPSAAGPQPSAAVVSLGAPVAGASVSPPAGSQAAPLPQAEQVMRTISPNPGTQVPQVLAQSPHAPVQEFPFPAINQYQALQNMQASMHVQAAQAQQHAKQLQPRPQMQAAQQVSQALQAPAQPHAQAQSVAQQHAQLQLLAAANWPQHAQPALAASVQAMLQQVISGMQRSDGSVASPIQTALSAQQQQQMLRLAASLPVQAAASQPLMGQPALRASSSQPPQPSPSATALGAQHQHTPGHGPHGGAGALHVAHPSSMAGSLESTRAVQGTPTSTAAQAGVAALLNTPPNSAGALVRSAHESAEQSLSQPASAHSAQHAGLQALYPTSPVAAAALAAAVSESFGAQGASASTQAGQILGSPSEHRSRAHGGAAQAAEAVPHPMRFAEQLQRGEVRAAAQPAAPSGHTAACVHDAPASVVPGASAAVPASQPGTGRMSAFMASRGDAPARAAHGSSDLGLHAAPAAAPPAAAPQQANGDAPAAGHAGSDGGDGGHRHWLLAMNVNEDTIRTWYSYARDHLKIVDPLHEAHSGDFVKFISDLQKSMAIHQYMAQARSQQPQHVAPAAQAPVLGQMVAHAAPQLPWTGAVSGAQPQAPVPHVPQWGFRPH